MRKKILFISSLLLFIFCFISVSSADTSYEQIGENSFERENTYIYTQFAADPETISVNSISLNPQSSPMVADLDGDGTNEVIIGTNTGIALYQAPTLDVVKGSYSFGAGNGLNSNIEIFDIDGDGKKELFVNWDDDLNMLRFDGTNLMLNWSNDMDATGWFTTWNKQYSSISCKAINKCVWIAGHTDVLYFAAFNSSGANSPEKQTKQPEGACQTYSSLCPTVPSNIPYVTNPLDGHSYYVISYALLETGSSTCTDEHYYIGLLNVSDNMSINEYDIINYDAGLIVADPGNNYCMRTTAQTGEMYGLYGSTLMSSPVVFDYDKANSGYEIVFAIMLDQYPGRFRIISYNFPANHGVASALIAQPSPGYAEGNIVSNAFRADIFPTVSSNKAEEDSEVCVLGYNNFLNDEDGDFIELVCASAQAYWTQLPLIGTKIKNMESFLSLDSLYNFSFEPHINNNMAHSIKASNSIITVNGHSNNPDEILSPYGILKVTSDDCNSGSSVDGCGDFTTSCDNDGLTFPYCELTLIYPLPVNNGAVISVNAEKGTEGYEDLILSSNSSSVLSYINDGFTNTRAEFINISMNPCGLDEPLKTNTSASYVAYIYDPDPADYVQFKVVAYEGTENEITADWTTNISVGADFTAKAFATMASLNKSGSMVISFYTRDTGNYNENSSLTATVYLDDYSGYEYGDCVSYLKNDADGDGIPDPIDPDCISVECDGGGNNETTTIPADILLPNRNDNAIRNTLTAFDTGLNLNLGLTVIWLVIMAGFSIYIVSAVSGYAHKNNVDINPKVTLAFVGIVDVILFIIGWSLGFLSTTILIIAVLLALGVFAFWIKQKMDNPAMGG